MYAKHGSFADVDASGAKASIKNHESRLEVIQSHAFWDHCVLLHNNVGWL